MYLTGKDGVVTIATVAYPTESWSYKETVKTTEGRAGGDGAIGRKAIHIDWTLECVLLIAESGTTPSHFSKTGTEAAFVAETDPAGSPQLKIAGTGLFTDVGADNPAGEGGLVKISITVKCSSPDVADRPTITYA